MASLSLRHIYKIYDGNVTEGIYHFRRSLRLR